MHARRRVLAVSIAAGALLAIGAASPASAGGGSGQTLGVGDSRCTDQVQSGNGARLTGFLTSGTGEWTVRRSSTDGGAETVVFRAPAGSLTGQQVPIDATVTPVEDGIFRYRACLSVDQVERYGHFSIANYRMSLTSPSSDAVDDIGPDTATLSASAQACGDQTFVQPGDTIQLAGTSTGPAQWIISVTGATDNYEGNWAVLLENATDIDRTITLDPEITAVTACAVGAQADGTISVGFELSVV